MKKRYDLNQFYNNATKSLQELEEKSVYTGYFTNPFIPGKIILPERANRVLEV